MELTLDTIKQLSPQRKAIALVIVMALLGYFYYSFFLQSSIEKRSKLSERQMTLDKQVTEKSRLAAQKDRYIKEVAQLQENLKMVLTKLPNEKDIPELFQAIALAGKSSGVEFLLFEPQAVVKPKIDQASAAKGSKDKKKPAQESFYEEIPLKLSVNGGFHQAVIFFEKVANLPRIINVQNIEMTGLESKSQGKQRGISTSCLMKTYMFLERKDEKKKN